MSERERKRESERERESRERKKEREREREREIISYHIILYYIIATGLLVVEPARARPRRHVAVLVPRDAPARLPYNIIKHLQSYNINKIIIIINDTVSNLRGCPTMSQNNYKVIVSIK